MSPTTAATLTVERPAPAGRAAAGPELAHVPELDGVRALALWGVLVAHLLLDGAIATLPGPLRVVINHAWLGVDLFFVLSGFLITGVLLRAKSLGMREYFRRFYVRRAARIWPLYFLVLGILFATHLSGYGQYFAMTVLMLPNFAPLIGVAVPPGALPYWSLGVEEQFYLLWPWVVLLGGRRTIVAAGAAVIALAPVWRALEPRALEATWSRIDGLALGSLLALWYAHWDGDRRGATRLALGLVGLAAAISILGAPFGANGRGVLSDALRISQAVAVFGALIVTAVAFSGAPALAPLRSRFATTTALFSYCIYIIHRPLMDVYAALTAGTPLSTATLAPWPAMLVRAICVLGAAYGLAALSQRFFEQPFLRWGRAATAGRTTK
jgi:peptidoglycan/LPS O-acetylase OafA/YrhL